MKIYIGFSSPKTWKIGAEAIKFWASKPYSHVFVTWKTDSFNRTLVYHAAHGQVHFLSMDRFTQVNVIQCLYELDITLEQFVSLVTKCIDLAGEKYGYIELLKIFVKDLCDFLSIPCKILHNDRGYICSELLAELLINLGVKFDRPIFLIRPDHVEKSLVQLSAKVVDTKKGDKHG